MPHLIPEENQEEVARIALRLYEEDRQSEEQVRQSEATQRAFEELGIPAAYLERAAEILRQEGEAQAARKQQRSRTFHIVTGVALTVPTLGLLLFFFFPQVRAAVAWWRTPTLTAQQTGTVLGRWKKVTTETPVAELRDATLEFFPNGNVILETPQQRAVAGSYTVDEKHVTTFTFPEYRGKVLSFSGQELRLLLHYNTYRVWGTKSGEAESVLTYERAVPKTWEQYLALCLLVGSSGIVGLTAMVTGATTATRSPKKAILTYFGVSAGLVTIALLARTTGFVWAGVPIASAYLGFCYGFLGKRLEDQQPTQKQELTED